MNEPISTPSWAAKIPARARPMVAALVSLALGFAAAVVLHYVLYRVGLPSRPFIYVAF